MSDVLIREVGLRDGLQLVKNILPTEKKIKWLNKQSLLNFKEIEVTSFVPKKVVPQFFDAKIILNEANKISNLTSSVLVPNLFGAKKALELNAQKINYVLSASESHNKANVNKDVNSSIDELNEIINYNNTLEKKSSVSVAISTSFGCSIEGKVSPNKSIYGDSGINAPVGYTATKAGIIGFTKYIAAHYGNKGLRANVLVPGGVENKNQSKSFKKNYSKLTPLKRMAKYNEYRNAVLFLVSDDSSYMTGSELIIDGGWTAW